jgi:hypothetical protein
MNGRRLTVAAGVLAGAPAAHAQVAAGSVTFLKKTGYR